MKHTSYVIRKLHSSDVFIEAFLISLFRAFTEITGSSRENRWQWVEVLTLTSVLFLTISLLLSISFFPACCRTVHPRSCSRTVAVKIRMTRHSLPPFLADLRWDQAVVIVIIFEQAHGYKKSFLNQWVTVTCRKEHWSPTLSQFLLRQTWWTKAGDLFGIILNDNLLYLLAVRSVV